MVYFKSILSFVFIGMLVSTSESTSVVTCMLCQVLSEPLEKEMTPTATVNAMFKKCDKMGLMEPVCEQFVSENVKICSNVFDREHQRTAYARQCGSVKFKGNWRICISYCE
ncbi:Protein CBG20161 [Caenorhabditis briggsae]|uniref:Protein CBG20161 n=1 Tax=Caenorhabditis briggsae TaxID=6238 RepID=A8XXA2_CAEBR|nr:Protein CBG20161 [Caenorhabditis briggsae]CAP37271.1 Protein CBG20161 [Caenorhabditis briggsae]